MKKFKGFIALLLSILMFISISACSPDYMDAYIYFELDGKPSTLDPQLVSNKNEAVIVRSIFDTLVRIDETGTITPSAASSFEKNGLTYTFNINEKAKWKDGTPLTAFDFEFAFWRALDPETASPAAESLAAVKSYEAVNDSVFSVTLSFDDPDFLKTLTSPVAMPCNKEYFEKTGGKYGLTIDTTPSCSSYYIRKWTDEDKFLIRLAKTLDYKGAFEARSMRVYFTADERDNSELLLSGNTDLAFVGGEVTALQNNDSVSVYSVEDTTYMLFLSPTLNEDIRSALIKSIKTAPNAYVGFNGCTVAKNIAPSVLGCNLPDFATLYPYDIATAIGLYTDATLKNSELSLKGLTLKCYSPSSLQLSARDSAATHTAKSALAHWQQNLGAFMNIEEVSSLSSLRADYENDNYTAIIMPVSVTFPHTASYVSSFKTEQTDIAALQRELGDNSLGYPLFYESSFTAATSLIKNFESTIAFGIPDVALLIKQE